MVNGWLPACKLTIAACRRSIEEREHPPEGWIWDGDFAAAVIDFAESLFHVTGDFAKPTGYDEDGNPIHQPIALEPWQKWWLGELYGWRKADNLQVLRFTEALLEISKKNGKTLMAAIIALYELAWGGDGAEIFSAAGKQDQAKIVWEMTAKLADRAPPDVVFGVSQITALLRSPTGFFKYLSKEAKNLDGPNPSLLLADEAAVIVERDVIEKLRTAMAARRDALTMYLTTAQTSRTTIYYERREALRHVLEGKVDRSTSVRFFGCIWSLDKDEEMWEEAAWQKANPNLGVSVQLDTLREAVAGCKVTPSQTSNVLRLNFNRWTGSIVGYVDLDDWAACKGQVIRDGKCWLGVDLAETNDLASVARLWGTLATRAYVDWHCWTNRHHFDSLPEHLKTLYDQAEKSGVLTICPGKSISIPVVEEYIRASNEEFDVQLNGFDRYGARQLVERLDESGIPSILVNQSAGFLNEPTRKTAALIGSHNLIHDGNPFVTWQVENCELNDAHDLHKVRKPDTDKSKKVDGITAAINAVSVWNPHPVAEDQPGVTVFTWG